MRIQNNLTTNPYNSRQKAKTPSSPSFLGPRLPEQSYKAFLEWAEQTAFCNKIPDILIPDNIAGTGKWHNCYQLPHNNTFLLKVDKKPQRNILNHSPILMFEDLCPERNIGQAIATLQHCTYGNIQVLIKQEGEPNGIKNWTQVNVHTFSKEHVPEFISQLKKVADVKETAYNLLTEEIILITEKGLEFDFYNPQNILVDGNKALNLVDVGNRHPITFEIIPSCVLHSLTDEFNFAKAYKVANKKQKQAIKAYAEIIKSKIREAAQKNYIANFESCFEEFLTKAGFPTTRHKEAREIIGDFSF